MTTESLITDELRAQIGVEGETFVGEITQLDIQRYALSVGDMNPLYFDEAYAKQTPYGGIIAPPNYLTAVITWGVGPEEGELSKDGLGLRRNEQAERNARRRRALPRQNDGDRAAGGPQRAVLADRHGAALLQPARRAARHLPPDGDHALSRSRKPCRRAPRQSNTSSSRTCTRGW